MSDSSSYSLSREQLSEMEFTAPSALTKNPSLFLSTQKYFFLLAIRLICSVLMRILRSRACVRLECHAKSLNSLSPASSMKLYEEMTEARANLERQLVLGQRDGQHSCLLYQELIDGLLDEYVDLVHAFFQRRCASPFSSLPSNCLNPLFSSITVFFYRFSYGRIAGFYRERIEISSYLLSHSDDIPINSPTYHCLYWVYYEFKMIEATLADNWFSIGAM